MKKKLVICFLLIAVLCAACFCLWACGGDPPASDDSDKYEIVIPTLPEKEEEGKVVGQLVVGEDGFLKVGGYGEVVTLRGVNLGGWLIQECWMCPVNGEDNEWGNLDTIEALTERGFTQAQIDALFQSYQDNWITEYDLDIIAGMGCNVVRVPFWYRNFMSDDSGTWLNSNLNKIAGFQRLDWVIAEAAERDMYVILDMHGVPGGQSFNHSTGGIGINKIYSDEACQDAMEKLWVAIAERYKNNRTVAAYDIMNEPHNNDEAFADRPEYRNVYTDRRSWSEYNAVYDRMIKAIREVDDNHVITVEGIWKVYNLPDPRESGWTNMMYQVHLYDNTDDFRSYAAYLANYAAKRDVAVYVGEFSNIEGIEICETYGVNWTTWTYKGGKGYNGNWFLYYADLPVADSTADSFDEMLEKWGEGLRTENFTANTELISAIRAATA